LAKGLGFQASQSVIPTDEQQLNKPTFILLFLSFLVLLLFGFWTKIKPGRK
jgi:hypothetical protein